MEESRGLPWGICYLGITKKCIAVSFERPGKEILAKRMITFIDPLSASIKGWNKTDLFSQLKKLFFFLWVSGTSVSATKTELHTFSPSFSQLYDMKYVFVFFKLK